MNGDSEVISATAGAAALQRPPYGLHRQVGPVGESAQLRADGVSARAREQCGDGVADHRIPAHLGGEEVFRRAQCPHRVVVASPQPGQGTPVEYPVVCPA